MNDTMPAITVCGSSAAEGAPAYFCDCRVCREAAAGGRKKNMGIGQ